LGLFLASGDPGKAEREQLTQALTEANQRINSLETKISDLETTLKNQQETHHLTLRRLDTSEENLARLRARIDEAERQIAALRKVVVAPVAKPVANKPTLQPAAKPAAKPMAVKR
jgi:predicted  nucleic acid-binding Zn-ribbon protein